MLFDARQISFTDSRRRVSSSNSSMKQLLFIFRKSASDQTVFLYGFKLGKGEEIRIIDEDRKSLDQHHDLLEIEGVRQEVESNTWSTQKTIQVSVSKTLYESYINGDYSSEYDALMREHRHEAGESTPTAPPYNLQSSNVDLATAVSQILLQQHSNQQLMEKFVKSMVDIVDKRDTKKMTVSRFDGSSEDART